MDQESNKQEDTPSLEPLEQNPMLMVKTVIPPTKIVFAEDQSKKNDGKDGE